MLANYLIGLREGIEAALLVSILLAYLVRTERREAIPAVWLGVGIALLASVGFGALLSFTAASLPETAEPIFMGVMSLIAVGFVTWMVFWMKKTARSVSKDLQGRLTSALDVGVSAIAVVAFIAVIREGLETSLFVWTAVQSTGDGATALLGAVLGLLTAVLLGWLFYKGAVRINLGTFFAWTGALLILVAAGVLAYGIAEFQEVGILPGAGNYAFDVSGAVPEDSWYGSIFSGLFNIAPAMTWLQVIAWVAYVAVVMVLFLRSARPRAATPAATTPRAAGASGQPQAAGEQSAPLRGR